MRARAYVVEKNQFCSANTEVSCAKQFHAAVLLIFPKRDTAGSYVRFQAREKLAIFFDINPFDVRATPTGLSIRSFVHILTSHCSASGTCGFKEVIIPAVGITINCLI